jgi:hypothetical protein
MILKTSKIRNFLLGILLFYEKMIMTFSTKKAIFPENLQQSAKILVIVSLAKL